ncbi:MAG TPA: glutamate-5-semialdehyde dehydrogenase [Polyangia bacterium]|nr:glutamate-5-semialdehyde dehydrogenase [Polyangia bacterium]
MSSTSSTSGLTRDLAVAARTAGAALAALAAGDRSALLRALAAALAEPDTRSAIFAANAADIERARAAEAAGAPVPASIKRLGLEAAKLDGVIEGLRQLAAMPEIANQVTLRRELDDGLILERKSCPLGVLGVVFEARPDAMVQIVGLAWKSGNAVLLKGGSEARESNRALHAVVQRVLAAHGLDGRAAVLLEDRADVGALLGLHGVVDLIVARGSSDFVQHVQRSTRIPVMGHAAGVCHLYLHADADPAMAARIAVDAKCSYPAACNSIEALLWDPGAGAALDASLAALVKAGVELRGCAATRARHPEIAAATDDDWGHEYGALVLAVRQVADLDGALAFIERYGSRHTEAIVTADRAAAERFLTAVDAGSVFHNASNRFADGFRYGLGAEVGVSTDKLHARGPVGVEGLLTYRWLLRGDGQVTTAYGAGGRRYTHRDLK